MTLPNLLTLSRLPLAGLAWVVLGDRIWLLALLGVAALTDVFDGRFARAVRARRLARGQDPGAIGEAEALGAWLDPVCDKIFAVSVLGAVAVGFQPPLPVVLLVLTREVLVAFLYLVYRLVPWLRDGAGFDFRAGRAGKLTTVWQFATVLAIVYEPKLALAAAGGASVFGVIAAVDYGRRGVMAARRAARNPISQRAGRQQPARAK